MFLEKTFPMETWYPLILVQTDIWFVFVAFFQRRETYFQRLILFLLGEICFPMFM
jgi:hypothetical protein